MLKLSKIVISPQSRYNSIGIDAVRDEITEAHMKAQDDLYKEAFGLLYPGKSIEWLQANAEEIDATYGFVVSTVHNPFEYVLQVYEK